MNRYEVWLKGALFDEFVGDYADIDGAIYIADAYKHSHVAAVIDGTTGKEVYRA